jgi:TonB family protein
MKKREMTHNELEQLFDRMVEQRPLLNEEQVISLLQQVTVTRPGRTIKGLFQNRLNTLILGTLVLGLAVILLWINKGPEPKETMVQNNQLQQSKVEPVSTDTLSVQAAVKITKDSIVQPVSVENTIKVSITQEDPGPVQSPGIQSVADIYAHFEKQPQLFTIDPDRDTSIICKEGTLIKIKAHTFVTEKTGKDITGKVQLEVKEYYTISDMLLSKLTTTSGTEMLETGGMLYMDAVADQEKCRIKQGSEIEIGFPYANKKEDMALFNGEKKNDIIDWKPAVTVNNVVIMTAIVQGMEEEPPYTIVEQMPEFPGGETALRRYMEQYVGYPYSALKDKIQGKVFVSFNVEKDGMITNIRVRRGLESMLDKVAVNFVSNMPKWIPGKQNGQAVKCTYTLPVSFIPHEGELTNEEILQSKALEEKIRNLKVDYLDSKYLTKQEFKEEFEKKEQKDGFQQTNTADLNRYVFSTSQLGWINCDKFIRDNRQKINYSIRIDQPGNAIATVIFHRYRSILPGNVEANRIRFMNVPPGEKISIVAFRTENDQIYLAIKETVITDKEENGLDFKPVTMELLKLEMEKLSKLN